MTPTTDNETMKRRPAKVSLAGWSHKEPLPPYPVETDHELITAVLSGIEDERTREDGRTMLKACIDGIYGEERAPAVRAALASLRGGPWLHEVDAAVFMAPDTILDDVRRGQLYGAFRMACAYLPEDWGQGGRVEEPRTVPFTR